MLPIGHHDQAPVLALVLLQVHLQFGIILAHPRDAGLVVAEARGGLGGGLGHHFFQGLINDKNDIKTYKIFLVISIYVCYNTLLRML